jgi:hypothetical protein
VGKLIMGMIIFQLIASVIGSFLQGGGGYVAEPLEANMGTSDTTISVMSTAEYLPNSIVTIDQEQIAISTIVDSTTLDIAQRGYDGTTISPHYQLNIDNQETMVYSQGAASTNNTMQVRVVTLQNSLDNGQVLSIGGAIVGLVATFLTSPLSFFNSDLWMFSAIYMAIAAALIIILAIAILGSLHIF